MTSSPKRPLSLSGNQVLGFIRVLPVPHLALPVPHLALPVLHLALPVPLQFLIPMWIPLALIHPYPGQFIPKEHFRAISAYPCPLRCGDQLWEREKGPSPWRMGTESGGVGTFLHTKESLNQKNALYRRRAKENAWKFFKKSSKHLLLMSKLCYKKTGMRTGW